jgi:UPF0755 protein
LSVRPGPTIGILALALGSLAAAFLGVRHALRSLDAPLQLGAPLRYVVTPGASFSRVAADLGRLGVVAEPRTWALFARWQGLASAVKAGEYEISPGMTARGLLTRMVKGEVFLHSFTIVDGWRVSELLAALRQSPDVAATLPPAPPALMALLGLGNLDAEGQFLPETYKFALGTTDAALLQMAHAAMARELETDWAGRDPNLPLHDPYALLTLASIVEKESALPRELGLIAGLYVHRLAIGMRLQADPTIIYGLGDKYGGELHTVDLRTDGPYNTYTRAGLPPTPIALPSAAALRASARPETTDAIFFVASDKGDGSHVFSATLAQQNAAVAKYVAARTLQSRGPSQGQPRPGTRPPPPPPAAVPPNANAGGPR